MVNFKTLYFKTFSNLIYIQRHFDKSNGNNDIQIQCCDKYFFSNIQV